MKANILIIRAVDGDKVVGRITSGNFGYSVGKSIGLAMVDSDYAESGTTLEVQYTGQRYRGIVSEAMLFDKGNERLKM